MLPPVLGGLVLLLTLGVVAAGLSLVLLGRLQRQAFLPRLGSQVAGLAAGGYAVLWVAALALSSGRRLPVGAELSFGYFDPHLHVSILGTERGDDLGVRVRFRSDAARAVQHPELLRLAVVDERGRRYRPHAGLPVGLLQPGQEAIGEFRFELPPDARAVGLSVTWGQWPDYLVPGLANPLVQRRQLLALGTEGGS